MRGLLARFRPILAVGCISALLLVFWAVAFSGSEIAVADLPPEARAVLETIERGGPFAYRKDGSVFGNRERLLPDRPRDYYREYTVPTPGRRDRGPRRIVSGHDGERYYTDDHYRSFRRIRQ